MLADVWAETDFESKVSVPGSSGLNLSNGVTDFCDSLSSFSRAVRLLFLLYNSRRLFQSQPTCEPPF